MKAFVIALAIVGALAVPPGLSRRQDLNDRPDACTNFLVTPGASVDGSLISYAADSQLLYGALYHYPAADHPAGSKRQIICWDTQEPLGYIPEVPHTYSVIGNMNEFALTIAETTWGGLPELAEQPGALIDYGSLMWITLQRARTAREAIHLMANLTSTYGYASSGESFSIGDPKEVWVMELIGKGKGEKGAVWAAVRVPDGYITSHANQARIRQFPLNDPDNCLYAPDVISFARSKGWYSGPDAEFSFSDTYNPVSFEGARACEARVWSFFKKTGEWAEADQYLNYAQGYNLTNRMPLWIRPARLLSQRDIMDAMRDHYEGTWFDFRDDAGAQAFGMPYRWRPLSWTYGGKKYMNERSTGTQQTGWSFVAQMRAQYPAPIGGILWFGMDDTATSIYFPFYCGIRAIPRGWSEESGDLLTFSFESAFWVFNMVAHQAYMRWSHIYPEVSARIAEYEEHFVNETIKLDRDAGKLWTSNPEGARNLLTQFAVEKGTQLVREWLEYWKYLFMRFLDGNTKWRDPSKRLPVVDWPGYPKAWYRRIVEETGDHYLVPGN